MISEKQYYKIMKRYFKSKGIEQDDDPYNFNCGYECVGCFLVYKSSCRDPFDTINISKYNIFDARKTIKKVEKYGERHFKTNKDKHFQMLDDD